MRLALLFDDPPPAAAEVEISSLAYDNRLVVAGTLFFCVPGYTRDGHDFAPDAIARGAAALVVERPLGLGVPEVLVPSVRAAMATAAARFHGDPTARLHTVGITGTNGKTTTAFLVRALLEGAGHRTGLLGTVKSVIGGVEHEVLRTTPEAIDLQRTFAEMLGAGDESCVMEVSSHALQLHRADAIHFAAAIFTNLTQDHLDFHETMEQYYGAKRLLFTDLAPAHAVINVDDPYGARLAAELAPSRPAITFALEHEATYRAGAVQTGLGGSQFAVTGPDGVYELASPLTGRFNVSNVLGAFATARALGVDADAAIAALAAAGQVPGRFQSVAEGQDYAVLVDYAHTPDSLENVLRAARPLSSGRLHVVFGCGGDRDRGKRPLMGEIAARLADRVIVTSDNPRSEDPGAIIEEILVGSGDEVEHEVDRRVAIDRAIATAEPGDVVVIAGKGHEQGQEFEGGRKIPFDDVTVVRESLQRVASDSR
ncbi:MAG TPA: UDP-N-acetylmuramoyl-L-alanyl-D-glutamate--2,6-diaminopimelate ligase [Solirubrobacteraceae bacterium]|nr:UDP-N-acetylmuramoyl-L-alanyl-D-glutamate--2,6-diaminopimelate ligase [Solirubrobacteraceae bacterium]